VLIHRIRGHTPNADVIDLERSQVVQTSVGDGSGFSNLTLLSGSIRGEMLDSLIEVVMHARGPAARAAVISELVQEMCATVEWLHDSGPGLDDPDADELISTMQLSRAAQDHQRRMSSPRRTSGLPRRLR
jgi:hypothetical protein